MRNRREGLRNCKPHLPPQTPHHLAQNVKQKSPAFFTIHDEARVACSDTEGGEWWCYLRAKWDSCSLIPSAISLDRLFESFVSSRSDYRPNERGFSQKTTSLVQVFATSYTGPEGWRFSLSLLIMYVARPPLQPRYMFYLFQRLEFPRFNGTTRSYRFTTKNSYHIGFRVFRRYRTSRRKC